MSVEIKKISFEVNGDRVIGNLYTPTRETHSQSLPAVIISGPMTSVKEQVTSTYAKALSQQGFITLAIDHRFYGESEGTPRQYENYNHKIDDLLEATQYLAKHSMVDSNSIFALGVCLGSGYAIGAATKSPHIKGLTAIAGYYRDVNEMKERDELGFHEKVAQGISARKHFQQTGEVITIPAASLETKDAAMQTADTVDYYTNRAAVPNYKNEFAVMSREFFLPFDVQSYAQQMKIPMLMVHSDKALSPKWADKFYINLSIKKEFAKLNSKGQTDFYDNPDLVTQASEKASSFFKKLIQI